MPDDIKLPDVMSMVRALEHTQKPARPIALEMIERCIEDYARAAVEADRARARQPDQTPPQATVVGTGIEMSVGVDVLCHAAAFHPDFWDGESGPDVPNIKITDPAVFAREVAAAINREAEDGSTLLTRMLDEAVRDAVESGCEGVDHG